MSEVLIVLATDNPKAAQEARRELHARGGKATQSYGPNVLIADTDPEMATTLAMHPGIVGVFEDAVPSDISRSLDETAQLGIAGWNQRHHNSFQAAKRQRKGEGLSWGHPNYEREG